MQNRWNVEILGHTLGINMHSPAMRRERKKICDELIDEKKGCLQQLKTYKYERMVFMQYITTGAVPAVRQSAPK